MPKAIDNKTLETFSEQAEVAKNLRTLSGYQYGASAFAQLASASINYDVLKIENMMRDTQADTLELQVKERVNLMREQFNEASGNAIQLASRRGVKTTEGSIKQNLEQSAGDFGTDVSKMTENAKAKARVMKSQSKINKRVGKAKLAGSLFSATQSGLKSYNLLGE